MKARNYERVEKVNIHIHKMWFLMCIFSTNSCFTAVPAMSHQNSQYRLVEIVFDLCQRNKIRVEYTQVRLSNFLAFGFIATQFYLKTSRISKQNYHIVKCFISHFPHANLKIKGEIGSSI